MPYIVQNGEVVFVTQAEFDAYTQSTVPPYGVTNSITVPAGGTVINVAPSSNSPGQLPEQILVPNTASSAPDQTLVTLQESYAVTTTTDNSAGNPVPPADPTLAPSLSDIQITATSVQTQTNEEVLASSAIQTTAASTENATLDAQAAARVGLTQDQLALLGAADATDPYIRANLNLPPLSSQLSQPTLVDAISNISVPSLSSIQTSIANTFATVSDYFSSSPNTSPSLSDIQITATSVQTQTNEELLAASAIQTSAAQQSDSYYQQLVQAFSQSDIQTGPAPFAPTAEVGGTTLVPASQVTVEPAPLDVATTDTIVPDSSIQANATDVALPENALPSEVTSGFYDNTPVVVDGTNLPTEVPVSEIDTSAADVADLEGYTTQQGVDVPESDLYAGQDSFTADELNAIADAQGVAGEEGNITSDTFAGQDSLTPEELDAIAAAQGVAGEEGNITADSLAKDPGSYTPAELDAIAAAQGVDAGDVATGGTGGATTEQQLYDNEAAAQSAALTNQARQQQSIAAQRKQINNTDWRVRLRLAPQSKYLYNAPSPGILQPLTVTDGVIFPYTPKIDTVYKANYDAYDLTHSNYKGYFYKNSTVEAINITATFTAQDTAEANYLLAVIHFFRSATKMFYGQDAERGAPPPLVYLTGLGEYQFAEHSCVIASFNYNLPSDVDYIRAGSPGNVGTNLTTNRDRQTVATNGVFGSLNRLAAAFLTKGAIPNTPAPGVLQINNPTYVPTKMDISLSLLPVLSRQQVSKQFSLKNFANGNLLKGGFW